MILLKILLIGLGSAVGGILRYLLSTFVHSFTSRSFPFGTLTVNCVGCFLMGILFVFLLERIDGMSDHLRALLLIGFLGGFTTFSSFSIETLNLVENGQITAALLNIVLSITLCLALTWFGILIGRL